MILGAIVTYNPDYDILNFNLKKLDEQVDHILIVNNGVKINLKVINQNVQLDIIENEENVGIAKALNIALDYAFINNYEYILTMDQDSYLQDGYVEVLLNHFNKNEKVGIVGPNIIEKELGENKLSNVTETRPVSHVITSGSLNLVQALKDAGGFDNKLFIDMVDLDISYRVIDTGYQIIQTADLTLEHRIGAPVVRKFLFKKHIVRHHAPFRKYFFVRNRLYIAFKYRKRGFKFVFIHLVGILYFTFLVIIFEKEKLKKLRLILVGIFDFLRGNYNNKIIEDQRSTK